MALFQVTKVNNEKIAVNPAFVMTVANSDVAGASTVIHFPPYHGAANTLYVHESFEVVLSMIESATIEG